jgi:hypothetical protein
LSELASKNMALWEQIQAASREAFTGHADTSKAADPDDSKTQKDGGKGK